MHQWTRGAVLDLSEGKFGDSWATSDFETDPKPLAQSAPTWSSGKDVQKRTRPVRCEDEEDH